MYGFISDLHLGTKLNPKDYLESLDKFFDILKSSKTKCKRIFVCGDLFDHKLSIDEMHFTSVFLLNLVQNRCGKNDTHVPVDFVHGTYTHDYDQYPIYLNLLKHIPGVEVNYYTEATIMVHDNIRILYLPQEYGKKDYTSFFEQEYDIIVGHGPISSKTKNPCPIGKYEILHSAELLGSISKICVFGHYHGYTDFGNNVFYAGPWLRWRYGEDIDRVFFFCDNNYQMKCVDNNIAKIYKTLTVNDPEELRKILADDLTTPHRFDIITNDENIDVFRAIINTHRKNENLVWRLQTNIEFIQPVSIQQQVSLLTDDDKIESLISYIDEHYNINASKEVYSYNEKINISKGNEL